MKVKIIKGKVWYENKVGKIYTNVVLTNKGNYSLGAGNRRFVILKEDAEVVEEVEKSCKTCGNNNSGFCITKKPCNNGLASGELTEWTPIKSEKPAELTQSEIINKLVKETTHPLTPKGCDNCGRKQPCNRCRNIADYKYWVAVESEGFEIGIDSVCDTCLNDPSDCDKFGPCGTRNKLGDELCKTCDRDYNYRNQCPLVCNGIDVGYKPKQATGTTEDAKHYQTGKQQPIEEMQSTMTAEQFVGFLLGNVIKYSLRMNHKGEMVEDAGKCFQYSKWLVQALAGEVVVPGGK